MPLLPESFSGEPPAAAPAARVVEPVVGPNVNVPAPRRSAQSGSVPLLKKPEREQAISELRALAERNAARSGASGSSHAARLRRLRTNHGTEALKQIESE